MVGVFEGVINREAAATRWNDTETWTRQSILTVARMGKFSSDRAIREYAGQIWQVQPMPVANSSTELKAVKRAQPAVPVK